MNILYIAPHLSTGGMPSFLLKRIEAIKGDNVEITVVEYRNVSDEYVVHKKKIKELANHFYTLGDDKMELIQIIKDRQIDIVHIEEMVEDSVNNFSETLLNDLYDNKRSWKIVETCHNIIFKPNIEKKYHPDAYIFCTPFHLDTFSKMPSEKFVIEYPIENKYTTSSQKKKAKNILKLDVNATHVLNVGLFTPGKNQKEGFEIARNIPEYQFHFVGNRAINFKEYWEPLTDNIPNNVHLWGEREDVELFMQACDIFMFNSTWECNPLVIRESISHGLPVVARNLPQYKTMFNDYIIPIDENNKIEQVRNAISMKPNLKNLLTSLNSDNFKKLHLQAYEKVINSETMLQKINIDIHFVEQPFLEIKGKSNKKYKVIFYDDVDKPIYETVINSNNWIKLNRRWFTLWKIKVWEDDELVLEYELNYAGKRVYIAFDSSSLGDNIAWMPYVDEFRKKHKCKVIVSTFKNFLFESVYPEIEFVNPGTVVNNIQGMYKIGWFNDNNKEPVKPNTIPLQKAATNILGLDYKEIKPKIAYTPNIKYSGKIVTIATNSTAGCKFWTREGWQDLIKYLHYNGYRIINVSKEENPFEYCEPLDDKSLQNAMDAIHSSEFFIGLSSGLSWLAWAMNKPVVMIANFSEEGHEFDCIRITNKSVCNGCWNKFEFDKSWNWCPLHKETDRMFECQTSISPKDVIEKITHLIHI